METPKPIYLTKRQSQIFDMTMAEMRNAEIARELRIGEKCVKFHKTAIFKACGVSNAVELRKRFLTGNPE